MAHLVTGRQMTNHVGSDDVGAFNAGVIGNGVYILNGANASLVDANTVNISGGDLLVHGRHIRIDAAGEAVKLETGSQGMSRNDLVGVLYTRDVANDSIEAAQLHVVKGIPTEGNPVDPSYMAASIIEGDIEVFVPLYRIKLNGLTVSDPELLAYSFIPVSEINMENLGVADYPIAEGKTDRWYWRKWASGRAECGCVVWCDGLTTVTQWGNLYVTGNRTAGNYPFAFKEIPELVGDAQSNGIRDCIPAFTGAGSKTAPPQMYFMRPDYCSTEFGLYATLKAEGWWK